MLRILHSVSNMDRAGIETMLMNYYRNMDREKIQFDFLCNKIKPGAYDDEIKSLGGRIYHTPGLNPIKYIKYLKFMNQLFKEHPEYRILEAHNGALGVYALNAAKKNRIPIRIFHAHGASITKDWKYPLKMVCKAMLPYCKNKNFTCGVAAAKCYFGKKSVSCNDYVLIPNAIETDRFIYNESVRNKIREEYGLADKNVIGHIGRFMSQKNHEFLIDVFAEYLKTDTTAVLVLLGDGELMDEIRFKVKNYGIEKNVLFIGNVMNANEWYQAFDCFVLPSVWEGLPVVGVEAQAADLPCIFSDSITSEIALTDKSRFISLKESRSVWADAIREALSVKNRKNNLQLIIEKNFDIKNQAVKLQDMYLQFAEESE